MIKILEHKVNTAYNGDKIVPIIEEILNSGGECRLKVTGYSMSPILKHNRDSVVLISPNTNPKRGDIVFIRRKSGEYILHRVYKVLEDGVIMNGDAQQWTEYVEFKQVIGVVKYINRNGRDFSNDNVIYKFIVSFWMILKPFRRYIFRLVAYLR